MKHVLAVLLVLLALLAVSHGQAQQDPCLDELMLRWNEFASNANNHIQTSDARRDKHEKTHRKLDHEWEALHALACW
jgi:hypothetical protein